jgi:hypothetical protein
MMNTNLIREHRIQAHAQQAKAFEDIESLIKTVRLCRELSDYRQVQIQLGQYIADVDSLVEDASTIIKRTTKKLKRLPYQKDTVDIGYEQGKLTKELQQAEFERDLYLRLGYQYRSVGDAMAWQLYGFRGLPIFALGINASPGPDHHSKNRGTAKEVETIDELWNDFQAFALRHGYTNLLRVWDLSIFYPDDPSMAYILEVKVKRKVDPKQKKMGESVAELVNKNAYIRPDGELFEHRKMNSSVGIAKTNIDLLYQAILQSLEKGVGFEANSYLAIVVTNISAPDKFTSNFLNKAQEEKTQKMLFPDIWPVYCVDTLIGTSQAKMAKPGFGVPYTVYPLPANIVSALVTGYLRVHYRLNTDAITQALCNAGFQAKCFLGDWRLPGNQYVSDSQTSAYFQVKRRSITLNIHALPVEQLLFDGLPLEDFVASIVMQCDAEEKGESIAISQQKGERRFHAMSTYTNMEEFWSLSRLTDIFN